MLLPNPVLENAVNPSAARIFASSPSGFRQTVLDCVLASKRVDGELDRFAQSHITICFISYWPIIASIFYSYAFGLLQYWLVFSSTNLTCVGGAVV